MLYMDYFSIGDDICKEGANGLIHQKKLLIMYEEFSVASAKRAEVNTPPQAGTLLAEINEKDEMMRKLALCDEILLQIEKPARYIGNEVNSVMKDKNQVDVRFCMCFPDVYEMSRVG